MLSLKQKRIQVSLAECVLFRFEAKMSNLEKPFTKKDEKEFKEDMEEGDQAVTEEILDLCDGTTDSVRDAMKNLQALMAAAMKEAEDAIKKRMSNTKAAKEAKGAVKELNRASATKRKGSNGLSSKNKRK
tara:strand:+ start:338 stop:727 length:390 start_codon:yes stop_codon:yes gene_type:complete